MHLRMKAGHLANISININHRRLKSLLVPYTLLFFKRATLSVDLKKLKRTITIALEHLSVFIFEKEVTGSGE